MIQFPPPQADDTQPRLSATQPIQPRRHLSRWLFGMIALLTSFTLCATFATFFVANTSTPLVTAVPKNIVLMQNGQRSDIITTSQTVADLLREQAITLSPQDALSDDPATLLEDGDIITIARARDVNITIDDVAQTIRTPFTLAYDILKQQAITLKEHDRVWLNTIETEPSEVALWQVPVNIIQIKRAVLVTIVDEDREIDLITTVDTVGEALFEANITLYLTDQVSPSFMEPLVDEGRIVITRAQPLTIMVDGTTIQTRVQGGTVLDALAETGVALVGLDYTRPASDTAVAPGMTVEIVRVTEDLLVTQESLPYETSYQADGSLPIDTRNIVQSGQNGTLSIETRIRYENGIEISRQETARTITQAPTNEVIAYGTQIVIQTITTADGTFEYWRKLRVYATSYHPAALGGDSTTSIGETLRKGIVAANPNIIPYRTNVYVEGYGTGFIADTGGPRSSPYWIDLGYSDADYVGWSRYVDIYLLTPVPANIDYLLPTWTAIR
jgi:resuscitation-promoting factor RpfB